MSKRWDREAAIAAQWWVARVSSYLGIHDTAAAFEADLADRAREQLRRREARGGVPRLSIEWDYHPDLLLSLALDAAGVDVIDGLPVGPYKRMTLIEAGRVRAKDGYAASPEVIYGEGTS